MSRIQKSTPGQTFRSLLEVARLGDQDALGRLIQECRNYLLSVASREMDRDLEGKFGASDIVQESMLTAHQQFPNFKGDEKRQFVAWLRQILVNDLYHAIRSFKGTQKRHVKREKPIQASVLQELPLADRHLTPQSNALAAEQARILMSAISNLPDDYRTVLKLKSFEDRNFREIGDLMARSPDAVRKLWARALISLREKIESAST